MPSPRPFCVNCEHHTTKLYPGQDQVAHTIHVCLNPDYAHVVNGLPIPAEQSRGHEQLCGFEGRGFKAKEAKVSLIKV